MAVMPVGVSAKPTKPFDVNRLDVDDAWPLSLWLFGGMFTQLLSQCGDPALAATLAWVPLRRLDDPVNAGGASDQGAPERISVAERTPKPDQVARFSALADEFSTIVLSAPGGLAYAEDFPIPGTGVVGGVGGFLGCADRAEEARLQLTGVEPALLRACHECRLMDSCTSAESR